MSISRLAGFLAGAGALCTLPFPYFVIRESELGTFTFGNPLAWATEESIRGLYAAVIEGAAGGAVAAWTFFAVFLAAGPVLVAYLSARMLVAAARKTRFGDVASAVIVLSYVFACWIVTQLLSQYLLLGQGFLAMTRPALWIACGLLVLGSIVREVTRE